MPQTSLVLLRCCLRVKEGRSRGVGTSYVQPLSADVLSFLETLTQDHSISCEIVRKDSTTRPLLSLYLVPFMPPQPTKLSMNPSTTVYQVHYRSRSWLNTSRSSSLQYYHTCIHECCSPSQIECISPAPERFMLGSRIIPRFLSPHHTASHCWCCL